MPLLKRIKHLFQPRALVLMYHRIADLKRDPWQLAVSPQNFEVHLSALRKSGKLISVEEMITSLQKKAVLPGSICLTFDDGYRDNYFAAKPLLEKYNCPATYFIPTAYIGQDRQFWWDELERIFLGYPVLPVLFSLNIDGAAFTFDLGAHSVLTKEEDHQHELWVWPAKPPTRRCELYLAIWEKIRPLPFNKLQLVLAEIKQWASFSLPGDSSDFPMTHEQLQQLAGHPYIQLGLHTETHPALSFHPINTQREEITANRETLEKITGSKVRSIAYPYGNYNENTLSVVSQMGLTGAFTTAENIVSNATDPYKIGRFQVRNWNLQEFEERLSDWLKSSRYV